MAVNKQKPIRFSPFGTANMVNMQQNLFVYLRIEFLSAFYFMRIKNTQKTIWRCFSD